MTAYCTCVHSDIPTFTLALHYPAGQSEVGGAVGVAKRLWLARKKVYFFTAWSVEHEDELCALARLVQLEYGESFDYEVLREWNIVEYA